MSLLVQSAFPVLPTRHSRSLSSWLGNLNSLGPPSSNMSASELPFQRWFKFKEAFSPSLIVECLKHLDYRVNTCLDPFGGCGTTGVTCQFLGIAPTLIEVNPFIADLAESKLAVYDRHSLLDDFQAVVRKAKKMSIADNSVLWKYLPLTFVEPGVQGRYLYMRSTMRRILAYREAIEALQNSTNLRLLKVLLGSILVTASNAVVNGKGRKYRGGWLLKQKRPEDIDQLFSQSFSQAVEDVERYTHRAQHRYKVLRGSCLGKAMSVSSADVAIFSPPYPNSFDYTDIYNIELWVLGYLRSPKDNQLLRTSTLRSHVQCSFTDDETLCESKLLLRTFKKLQKVRSDLWDPRIPEMILGYFSDLTKLLRQLRSSVRGGGSVFVVVGDSRYKDVSVRVSDILVELSQLMGFRIQSAKVIREMRTSAQQGGLPLLRETVLHLKNQKH